MPQSVITHFRKTNNNIEIRRVFENAGSSDENVKIPNPVQTFEQAFHVIKQFEFINLFIVLTQILTCYFIYIAGVSRYP